MNSLRKIAGIALITGLIGLIGMFVFRDQIFSIGKQEQFTSFADLQADAINQLDIEVDIADFQIEKSPDNNIHVALNGQLNQYQEEKMTYEVYDEDNTLFIKLDQQNSWWFSFAILPFQWNDPLELVLQLPEKQFKQLRVDANVADLAIRAGNYSAIEVSSDVGDLKIANIKSNRTSVETNVGDIAIETGSGSYQLISDVGEISLSLIEWNNDITIESDVGDIDVTMEKMPQAYQMDLSSDVGGVHTSGIRLDRAENDDGNIYIEVGTDGPRMDLSSDVGEIEVIAK